MSLKKLDFLSREQLQRIHRLGKVRNANRVLSGLSPYLQSYREGYSTIYYLSALGRETVASNKVRRKNQFVGHVLMRNDFYIFLGCPLEWKNEVRVKDGVDSVICDAFFKYNGKQCFLEVDYTQKMSVNRAKIAKYKEMFQRGHVKEYFGYFPTLYWLTTSELRRKQLQRLCEGLPCEVYTIQDIK